MKQIKIKQDTANKLRKVQSKNILPSWAYRTKDGEKIKVDYEKLGKLILNENRFIFINNKGKENLYQYHKKGGFWSIEPKGKIKNVIASKLSAVRGLWSIYTENIIYSYVSSHAKRLQLDETFNKPPKLAFNFKNGVFNWDTMQLEKHDPSYYFTSVVDYDLKTNKNIPTPETEKYFELFFQDASKTMKEAIGYSFYPSYKPIQEFIILYGKGGEGKSWFLSEYLTNLIGENNTSFVQLTELTTNKEVNFKISELQGKYLNISSELKDNEGYGLNTATLKRLTGNDKTSASVKGKNDINMQNYAKLFIATNELVSFSDNSNGFKRRIYIIDTYKINNFEKIINKKKLLAERSAFVYKCILLARDAMKRVAPSGHHEFTKTARIEALANKWFISNDPLQQFIDDCLIIDTNEKTNKRDMWQAYRNWCDDYSYKPLKPGKFKLKLEEKGIDYKAERPSKMVNGKQVKQNRIYYFTGCSLNSNADPVGRTNPIVKINKY